MTNLVTFGEATLRLRPRRGHTVAVAETFDADSGGPEANAAIAASALGTDAVWLSRLPDSPLGRRVVNALRSHGVRTGVTWGEADDHLATAFVEAGVEPRDGTTMRHDADTAFTEVHAANLPLEVVQGADYFHVTGITVSRSKRTASATATLLEGAGEADTTTAFDLRYRERCWTRKQARSICESLFDTVDVLFATHSEAEELFDEEGAPVDVAHALRTRYEFETVVLTRQGGSALAAHGDEVYEAAAVEAEVIDAAGSEDAFVGGFLAKRIAGGGIHDALEWATAMSALAKTFDGTAVSVSPERVEGVAGGDSVDGTGR